MKSETLTGAPNPYYLSYDVTGKITGIYSDPSLAAQFLQESYAYDEMGNCIKTVNPNGTTYYVYDANANVLAIYTGSNPAISEIPVYGSGNRLGTYNVSSTNYVYELRDNVESVRAVINRNKNNSGQADILQYNDYFPYGSIAQRGGTNTYRYDYQGAYAEKDPYTLWNNFKLRMYDGRVGRWLTVDPMGQYASPYLGMGNNPILNADPLGGWSSELWAIVNRGFYVGQPIYNVGGDWGFNAPGYDGAYFVDHTPNLIKAAWNTPVARYLVPDIVHIGVGYTAVGGVGTGGSIDLNLVTRGKRPFTLVPTSTLSVGTGYSFSATVNLGGSYYTGDINQLDPSMLETDSRKKGTVPGFFVSGAVAAGGKVGLTGTVTKTTGGAIIDVTVNAGAGAPAGAIPVNGTIGASNTYILGGPYKTK